MSLFSQSGVQLSHIEKLSPQSIEATFEAALQLLQEPGWSKGKLHKEADNQHVQMYKLPARANEKLQWHMRSSEHPVEKDLPYDSFRSGLLLNHAENEHEYIPDQKHCECVKVFHEGLAEGGDASIAMLCMKLMSSSLSLAHAVQDSANVKQPGLCRTHLDQGPA